MDLSMILKPLENQVGGLGSTERRFLSLPLSMLQNESLMQHSHQHDAVGVVLKPVREDQRGIREIAFYEQLLLRSTLPHVSNDDNHVMLEMNGVADVSLNIFEQFIPIYYGVIQKPTTSERYVLLQDVTRPFQKPHIIDIKMGQQTWEPGESLSKVDIESSKYPMQERFGLRITGMRIFTWDPSSKTYVIQSFDKQYGRSLNSRDKLSKAFQLFFTTDYIETEGTDGTLHNSTHINIKAIHIVLIQLYKLRKCLETNNYFGFFASSMLIVVEGCANGHSNDNEIRRPLAEVKMIDFGHVQKGIGRDVGYLHGIATLCDILENIL